MFIFYPIIIALGICSSYTDIRFKKIKNNHLILATIIGLITYIYLISNHKININVNLIINPFIGLSIGFLLWFNGIWGAGDAKLFTVLCLLMPTEKYSQILPFPSLIVFLNIFLISALVILIMSIGQIVKNRIHILKRIFSVDTIMELINSFLIVFSLGWLISLITKPINTHLTAFLQILILYFSYLFIYRLLNNLKNNRLIFIIFGTGLILRFIFQFSDFTFLNLLLYLKKVFSYTLIFYILNIIFDLNKDEKIIPFAPLMFLGAMSANTNLIYWAMHILNLVRR